MTKCIEKIVYTNRHTEQTFVIFEVPKILIGYPSYDMKSCIIYLMNQLSRHNYMVDFIHPFYLYIDWGSNHKTSINQKMISQQIISDKLKSKLPLLNTNNEKLTKQWSPVQISGWLMRSGKESVSFKTIYNYINNSYISILHIKNYILYLHLYLFIYIQSIFNLIDISLHLTLSFL